MISRSVSLLKVEISVLIVDTKADLVVEISKPVALLKSLISRDNSLELYDETSVIWRVNSPEV